MNAQALTLDQIKKVGIEILREHLGVVGMIRFLQQSENGWGDYTKDREKWLGNPDLKTLFDSIKNSNV
jgi:hypothetical protein